MLLGVILTVESGSALVLLHTHKECVLIRGDGGGIGVDEEHGIETLESCEGRVTEAVEEGVVGPGFLRNCRRGGPYVQTLTIPGSSEPVIPVI